MEIINAQTGSFATSEKQVMKKFQDVLAEEMTVTLRTTAFVQLQTLQQIQPHQQVRHRCQRLLSQRLSQLMSRRLFQLSSRRLCRLMSLHLCKQLSLHLCQLLNRRQPHSSPSLSWNGRYLALITQRRQRRLAVIADRLTGRLHPLPARLLLPWHRGASELPRAQHDPGRGRHQRGGLPVRGRLRARRGGRVHRVRGG